MSPLDRADLEPQADDPALGIPAIRSLRPVNAGILLQAGYITMQAEAAGTPMHCILLVEDDLLIRLTTTDFLESCGYTVLQAEDAAEAMASFDQEIMIDLVFTDLQMPGGMDGVGLARWVKVKHPGVPVIVTSGVIAACDEDIGPMIRKPYDLDVVHQCIQEALRKDGDRLAP